MQVESGLNSRLANYADRVTVDICGAIAKKYGIAPDLELRTWIRVHVGVTARESAIAGMSAERAHHERRGRPPLVIAPDAVAVERTGWDDAPTEPSRRRPDHGDE